MERVFLDANVLFSAAYKPDNDLRGLWRLAGVELVSAEFVIDEARRNLSVKRPSCLADLQELVSRMTVLPEPSDAMTLDIGVELPPEDKRVLIAAVLAKCDFLLTGDRHHFRRLMENPVGGVRVQLPRDYIRSREREAHL